MCRRCGRWYAPDTLDGDDDGLCYTCSKRIRNAIKRSNFQVEVLYALTQEMRSNFYPDENQTSLVYFIIGRKTKLIKIGYTSATVYGRMRDLQVGSPDALELLGVIDAPISFERELHHTLAAYHSHGEWFELFTDFRKYIADVTYIPNT